MAKMFANVLVALLLVAHVAALFLTSGTVKAGAITLALILVVGAGLIFFQKLRQHLTRQVGKALFEDSSASAFDADAAFERAMRKRASTGNGE